MTIPNVLVGELALNDRGAFKIGPFGSSLKKSELVAAGIPVVGIENILANMFIPDFRRFVTSQKFEELADYEIAPNDILVTTMGTIGRSAVVPASIGRAIFDSHLFRMRVNTKRVDPAYLCYALNSRHVASQLTQKARGAIMEGLNTTILRECSIPLPTLSEQQRVAKILRSVDQVRTIRRYAVTLSDQLSVAVFLRMFGDPKKNLLGFPIKQLQELIQPTRPITYGILMPGPHIPDGVSYIRVTDIQGGQVITRNVRRTTKEIDQAYKRSKLKAGELLLSIRGHVGRMAIVPAVLEGANITQDTARLAPVDEIDPHYLMGCLATETMQHRMHDLTRGAAVQGINLGDVKELPIPVPPRPLQNQYAMTITQHERLRSVHQEASRQADHLFESTVHQAFSAH